MKSWTDIADRLALQRNVLVISVTLFFMVMAFFSWYLLLPIYLRQLGANNFQVGLSYSLLTISYSARQIVGGFLADRVGRQPVIVGPTFCAILFYDLAGISHSWQNLVLFLVLVDMASAMQWPAFLSMLSESVSARRQGAAFSLMELFIVAGMTVGPAAGAALLPRIGFSGMMMTTAFLALPCALVRTFLLRETLERGATQRTPPVFSLWRRPHWSFLKAAIFLAIVLTLTMYGPFIALYAKDIIGLAESRINLMFALGGLAAISVSLVGGRIIDRTGSLRVLRFCLLAFPLMLIAWTQTDGFVGATVLYMVAYLFFHVVNISYQTQLTSIGPSMSRGSLVGIFGSISGVVSAIGPLLGGLLVAWLGQATPFYLALFFALLSFCFFARTSLEAGQRDESILKGEIDRYGAGDAPFLFGDGDEKRRIQTRQSRARRCAASAALQEGKGVSHTSGFPRGRSWPPA